MRIDDSWWRSQSGVSKLAIFNTDYLKQEYCKKGYGCGKRKRTQQAFSKTSFNFWELKKQIETIQNHCFGLSYHKAICDVNSSRMKNSLKKRCNKFNSKEFDIAIWPLMDYEKKILQLIILWREQLPRVYKKLLRTCSKYFTENENLFTQQQKILNLNNLNPEDEVLCRKIIDDFLIKVNQHTLLANAKLSNPVVVMVMEGINFGQQMTKMNAENNFCALKISQLAISNTACSELNDAFINPVSSWTVEEVD